MTFNIFFLNNGNVSDLNSVSIMLRGMVVTLVAPSAYLNHKNK